MRYFSLLCALCAVVAGCRSPGKGVIALEGATLIDGSGGAPRPDAIILVPAGKNAAAARVNEIAVPREARVMALPGKTIIPGLIDAHAHVECGAVPRYLAWGVTAVLAAHLGKTDALTAGRADPLGLLAPGRAADLVVLNADPARDIAATTDIAWVMVRGRIVRPDSVRAAWGP